MGNRATAQTRTIEEGRSLAVRRRFKPIVELRVVSNPDIDHGPHLPLGGINSTATIIAW
jgi:hypothetical protein